MSISGISNSVWPAVSNQTKPKLDSIFTPAETQPANTTALDSSKSVLTEVPSSKSTSSSNPAKELQDYMNMSDAEKMQYSWLSSHGISKEQFDAMSPADKQKLIDQMRAELQQKMEAGSGKSPSISIKV